MEGERDNIDQFFQDRFATFERLPSKSVWDGIKKYGLMANGARLVFLGNYGYLFLLTIVTAGVVLLGSLKSDFFGIGTETKTLAEQTNKPKNKPEETTTTVDEQENKQELAKDNEKKSEFGNEPEEIKESARNIDISSNKKPVEESAKSKEVAHSGVWNLASEVNGGGERQFTRAAQGAANNEGLSNQKNERRRFAQETNSHQDNLTDKSPEQEYLSRLEQVDPIQNDLMSSATDSVAISLLEETDRSTAPLPIVIVGLNGGIPQLNQTVRPEINGDIRLTKPRLSITDGMTIVNFDNDNDSLSYRGWALSLAYRYETIYGKDLSLDIVYYLSSRSFLEFGAATGFRFIENYKLSYNYMFGKKRLKPMAQVEFNSRAFERERLSLGLGLIYDIKPESRWRLFFTATTVGVSSLESVFLRFGGQYRFTSPSKYDFDKSSSEYKWYISLAYSTRFGNAVGGIPAVEAQLGKYIGKRTFFNASLNTELFLGAKLEHYFLTKGRIDLGVGFGIWADTRESFNFQPVPEVISYYDVGSGWKVFGRYALRGADFGRIPKHVTIGVQRGILKR